MNDEEQALLEEAERVAAAMEEAEHMMAALREERAIMIRKMRAANISWPAIGKALNCTHQAAMYASGLVERSKKS